MSDRAALSTSEVSRNSLLPVLLSLIIPGAGQFYLKQRNRGLAIFAVFLIQFLLTSWAFDNYQVGLLVISAFETNWLWIFLVVFWVWNVNDAHRLAQNKRVTNLFAMVIVALVVYIIAWQVTDVQLVRLVTRFGNALKIGNDLIHPDLFTQDASGNWVPSENFGYIFGTIEQQPPPELFVRLGLVSPTTMLPTYQAGKIVETIALGFLATVFSTIIALPLSFFAAHNVMVRVPFGNTIYYVTRIFFNVVRSVDTLIWGLIVILWVGLGPFAGVIALTIHSVAALGKLYSEEIEHIDPGPVEAITATGATFLQTIRYAVFPQIVPPFVGYTLLRWDINMRSATIVGFVAGGGIGYFVVETLRKSAYNQYAAALWAIAVVIMVVDFVSAKWRERISTGETQVQTGPRRPFYLSLRFWFYLLVGIAVFAYFWSLSEISLKAMLSPAPTLGQVAFGFINLNLDPPVVSDVVNQMLVTIFQALLATTLGSLVAVPFSFLAAHNLTGRSRLSAWLYYATRGLFNFLRSIEALLYVAIFFYWVSFGSFAGMLALAVTTFGLIGKLFSEAIENIDPGPHEAIIATGATRLQAIVFGVLPQIIPPFISYAIYQWDINVRLATIVGFAGGGGIGNLLLNDYFAFSKYRSAGTAVALIVLVVILMDFASARIRRRLV